MKKFLILIIATSLIMASCKVTWTPKYDPAVVTLVESTQKATDDLYDQIVSSSDKSYDSYKTQYENIIGNIALIKQTDSSRVKAVKLLNIISYIQERFIQYRDFHLESKVLNNYQAKVFKEYMDVIWKALLNAEKNLNQ